MIEMPAQGRATRRSSVANAATKLAWRPPRTRGAHLMAKSKPRIGSSLCRLPETSSSRNWAFQTHLLGRDVFDPKSTLTKPLFPLIYKGARRVQGWPNTPKPKRRRDACFCQGRQNVPHQPNKDPTKTQNRRNQTQAHDAANRRAQCRERCPRRQGAHGGHHVALHPSGGDDDQASAIAHVQTETVPASGPS